MHTHATAVATTRAHSFVHAIALREAWSVECQTLDALQRFHGWSCDPRETCELRAAPKPFGARCTLRAASQLPPVCSLRLHTVTRHVKQSVANRSRPRGRLAVDVTSSSRRSRKMSEDRLYRIDIYDERAEARPSNGLNYMKAPKAAVR